MHPELATTVYLGLSLQALVLIAVTLTQTPAYTQIPDTISRNEALPNGSFDESQNSSPLLIRGFFRDSITNDPIPFLVVELTNKGQIVSKAQTNSEGYFQFRIESTVGFDSLRTSVFIDYYEPTIIPLTTNTILSPLEIRLEPVIEDNYVIGIVYVNKKTMRKNKRIQRREARKRH